MDDEHVDVIMPVKVKTYAGAAELLAKLEGRAAMWERVARENKERAEEFEDAARQVREGAVIVVVGRTTYVVDEDTDTGS